MIVRKPRQPNADGPVSLYTLLGRMEAQKQFIAQALTHSEEYWNCQRDLAEMERTFAQANEVWMTHQRAVQRQ